MNLESFEHQPLPVRAREGSFDSTGSSEERRQELAEISRGLRRMKRQMLLKHVEGNQEPVISLRDLLIKAASGECRMKPTPPSSPRFVPPSTPRASSSE